MSSAPPHRPLTIGVLALQGAYDAHATALEALGATPRLVRTPEQLAGLDGLIMPGGESTTMLKSLERGGFFEALAAFVAGKPTFGTCAGAIREFYAEVPGGAGHFGGAKCVRATE
jgi:5'-phosphate synthase pdxT subunit